jgi:hypothetical protein
LIIHPFAIVVAAIVLVGASTGAAAQSEGSDRPYNGLFGGSQASSDRNPGTLNLTLAQGYDDVVGTSIGSIGAPEASRAGQYTSLSADLGYGRRGRKVEFTSAAGSTARYYAAADQVTSLSYYADAGLSVQLMRRSQLTLNQSASYAPSYFSRLFPAVAPGPASAQVDSGQQPADYAADASEGYRNLSTALGLTHSLTRRDTLSFSGSFRSSAFSGATISAYVVRGQFSRGLTRRAVLRVGYGYREAFWSYLDQRVRSHDIDLGVDYRRTLSFSRRTRLGFTFGSTLLRSPLRDEITETTRLQYRAVSNAWLDHQFGRTWNASLKYERGVGVIDGLAEPVFTDGVSLNVGGLLNRRTTLSAIASYSAGESAFTQGTPGFDTYMGAVRLGIAVSKSLSTFADYTYYSYDFSQATTLLDGAPEKLGRNALRVGLAFWTPFGGR